MKYREAYFNCGDYLRETLADGIDEIISSIAAIPWSEEFELATSTKILRHQAAYNQALASKLAALGWEQQPLLRPRPRLRGDFRKGLIFVEVQFGNSSTLYRDYYKFQYGHMHGLLGLAVLIVPHCAREFFPSRPKSVSNMAEFSLAETYLTVLPIGVPTLLIGLLPEN